MLVIQVDFATFLPWHPPYCMAMFAGTSGAGVHRCPVGDDGTVHAGFPKPKARGAVVKR